MNIDFFCITTKIIKVFGFTYTNNCAYQISYHTECKQCSVDEKDVERQTSAQITALSISRYEHYLASFSFCLLVCKVGI